MAEAKELEMRFDPNTIEHLGVKMYSQIPTAIAELVANAYDANAEHVVIILQDGEYKSVVVKDDGDGMTFDEINDCFLLIGRNRRNKGEKTTASGRVITGRKGLGKLALFGIGDTIEVSTAKDGELVTFRMNWSELKKTGGGNYKPTIISRKKCGDIKGTTIALSDLKRKSPFDQKALAVSLSKLFNFFDDTFKVIVKKGDVEIDVNNELKYESLEIQFDFCFPAYSSGVEFEYDHKREFQGKILTTEKPLKPGLRGITLFANGRLVNAPEFFGRSESNYFYSYVTGWLNVDFVDNWDDDVISTNRQSLNWDLDGTKALRDFLQATLSQVQRDWREKRAEEKRRKITEKINIDVTEWYGKLPNELRPQVESIVDSIEKSELPIEDQAGAVGKLHQLIPEYTYYHFRYLHPIVQDASDQNYKSEDYYNAFIEAAKRYINTVRSKSGSTNGSDSTMMMEVFGPTKTLAFTKKHLKSNGEAFNESTIENIENGQASLSRGVVQGGRNPLSHEEMVELKKSGLFSEKDCLDLLSLISHLFERLDNSEIRT